MKYSITPDEINLRTEFGLNLQKRVGFTMKKLLSLAALLGAVTLALALTACAPTLRSLSLGEPVEMEKGKVALLTPTFAFEEKLEQAAFDKAVSALTLTYTSSDPSVATVDATGAVTGVGGGVATITAALGKDLKSTCEVTVRVPIEWIAAPETITLETNGKNTEPLQIKISPPDATKQTITYSSEDETIATVDKDGIVTAVGKGETSVISSCGSLSAKTAVIVTVKVTGITLDSSSGWVYVGGTAKIVPYTVPVEADATTYTFASDNTKVATVNGDGVITGKAVGSAKITVEGAGYNATYTITVKAKPAPVVKPTKKGTAAAGGTTAGGTPVAGGAAAPTPAPTPAPAPAPAPAPSEPQHYHGNGSDAGQCPVCGLHYSPIGGLDPDAGHDVGDLT